MIPAPEKDPNGVNQHDAGAKLDEGKLRYSLIPPGPLRWLAALYTKGAAKYSAHGWKSVKDGEERYLDALIRHLEAYRSNEWLDPDTQVPHIIGVAWNAFAICFYRESYIIKPQKRELDMSSLEWPEENFEFYKPHKIISTDPNAAYFKTEEKL